VHCVNQQWLVELAPQFYQAADPNKMTRQKRMQKIEPLYDRYVVFAIDKHRFLPTLASFLVYCVLL
jgi:hypothetical protein